ncbi:Zinc finger, C3HC4 type (RING finger) family protein [Leishmania donovani]|nr:Zinc finger, C3HC4 type (RING finger) family protein [Leishmania donovani]TPP54276.1 Zinc finger, C3HC4 type (RING finger) family protein [Leishmania donovani]
MKATKLPLEMNRNAKALRRRPPSTRKHGAQTHTERSADVRQHTEDVDQTTDHESSDADAIVIPDTAQLMQSKRLQILADQLERSLRVLGQKLDRMQMRMENAGRGALLPFQLRRAKQEKEELKREIMATQRTIKRLIFMSTQMKQMIALKNEVLQSTRARLLEEIKTLETQVHENAEQIRRGYVQRISMLQRYWPWRQLRELGDTTVGKTFEEELARGPRYRNIGIQNNIQTDYIVQQLHWLQELGNREGVFRGHLRLLEGMVEDLNDITDLLETTMTCTVCGMLYENPVILWPCGHSFCLPCVECLAIAPSLYRCPTCGSIGSEGFVHNLLLAETVAKWMFKDKGYGDTQAPLNAIRVHLPRFRQDSIQSRISQLKKDLRESAERAASPGKDPAERELIAISYRLY